MHTIIFSNYDDIKNPYYGGGGAVAIHEICKRLAGDFKVKVLTGKYPGSKNEAVDGVYYKRVGLKIAGPKLGQVIFQWLLPFYALREKFDVWVESFVPPFTVSLLPVFTRKPVIGLVHMLPGKDMERKYKLPFQFLERYALKIYKNFIVMQESCKQKLLAAYRGVLVQAIPNGVDLPRNFSQKILKTHILYIGRIEVDQKGLDLLLKAYGKIHEKIPYKLLIAGSGVKNEEAKLLGLIAKSGLKEKVIFAGRVRGQQKDKIFRQSIFAVAPSRFETFGITALEALAYALPLLAFDIEGFKWITREASVKVKPFDVNQLASAMQALAEDKNLRDRLGLYGRKEAEKYSWDAAAEKYKSFILPLIPQVQKALVIPENFQNQPAGIAAYGFHQNARITFERPLKSDTANDKNIKNNL